MNIESFQIYLNSQTADYHVDNAYYFNLPVIEVDSQRHLYVSVANASIPISYYNVNIYNNVLKYTLQGDSNVYTVTIPRSNYSAITLKTYLNSVMTNFTVSYDIPSNKYTFTHATTNFTFTDQSTCLDLLGFNLTEGNTSTNRVLTSVDCCDFAPTKGFCICSNLQTNNFNKATPNTINILLHIPVNSAPNAIQIYENINNFRNNLFTNTLSQIMINIMNQNCKPINFNGVSWSITLQIDIVDFVADNPYNPND